MAGANIITEFYKDSEIFLTGGSGIIGKATIEKLLRSCDVKRIYILLRPKKFSNVEERLEKIKDSKIFRVLKTEKPNELDKLVAIPGDVGKPNLGITPEYAKLMENVSIIFHSAATVRFNEPLDVAMQLNVGGTWKALNFATTLKKLKIFLHISTFYSNPYLERVEEKVYSSPIDWRMCLDLMQDESKQDLLDVFTKKITVGFPNTYCFTKNIAETIVKSFHDRLPVAIYRPSIVIFSMKEPEIGFPPALVGAMGLLVSIGTGVLKVVYRKDNQYLDLTPLDTGIMVMLAQTVQSVKKLEMGNVTDIPLFHFSSCKVLPLSLDGFINILLGNRKWDKFALWKSLASAGIKPVPYFTDSEWCYKLVVFTHQVLPAALVDVLMALCGRKPIMIRIMRKIIYSQQILTAFLHNSYDSNGITDMEQLFEITQGTEFDIKENIADVRNDNVKIGTNLVQLSRVAILNEDPSILDLVKKYILAKNVFYNVVCGGVGYFILRSLYNLVVNYVH